MVQRIHRLGDRPVHELVEELIAFVPAIFRADIESILVRYAALDSDAVRELGTDRINPAPLHLVARC
jgi:hypothetical protein